jgi:hypothetical protein
MGRFNDRLTKKAEVDFGSALREWGPSPLMVDFVDAAMAVEREMRRR